MLIFKALACFLLLPGYALGGPKLFGSPVLYISASCLLRMCYPGFLDDVCNSPLPPNLSVYQPDADAVRDLHYLISPTSSFTRVGNSPCSCDGITRYRMLIDCYCGHGSPPNSNQTICRVTKIDFSNMELRGTFPVHIENLDFLSSLDLSKNCLSGSIPTSIVNLTNLSYVDLSGNNLGGSVPPFNGKNKELRSIYLGSNQLSGSIPKEFGELPSLETLNLRDNELNGSIPDQIWNIKSLVELSLQDNPLLGGQIPEHLGNLGNLQTLANEQ